MTGRQREALRELEREGRCTFELASSGLLRVVLDGRELALIEPGGKVARGLDPVAGLRLGDSH